MDDELDRYESAAGWEPPDPYKKRREAARKQRLLEPDPSDSMLETRPAGEWIIPGGKQHTPSELFGPLWREGEVAVLFGETGVGKSILAVQIAEDIARGKKNSPPGWFASEAVVRQKPRKVLYLDFEHNTRQFTERYSAPSPIPGKLPIRQRFRFQRSALDWDGSLPPAFKNAHEFLMHSIFHEIKRHDSRVVIIDNISYLAKNVASRASCLRLMTTLRHWAACDGLSILVLAQAKTRNVKRLDPKTHHSPLTTHRFSLADLAAAPIVAELADSVFAIGRSTLGTGFRYIKHLKSRNAPLLSEERWTPLSGGRGVGIEHDAAQVIACQIGRDEAIHNAPNSSFEIGNSPFLQLSFHGLTPESIHLTDPLAAARLAAERERRQLPKPKGIVNMLMSREYKKYLDR